MHRTSADACVGRDAGSELRALLFSDVENSTEIAHRLGTARAEALWVAHDRCARDLLALHEGREIGRSDGMFLMFEQPAHAARYALDYQAALSDLGLRPRVGIHAGPVTLRRNSEADIARGAGVVEAGGPAIAVAARLMALASGGQTLASTEMRERVEPSLSNSMRFQSHGFYRLKGFEDPVEVHELGLREFARFQPPPDVAKAYRVARVDDLWLPVRDVRHNLPAERDAFVGRDTELRMLATRLGDGAHLVTLQGPGGTGKTRLARRYAWTWLGDWPGGVVFCDLSEARTLDDILSAVARALAIPLQRREPVDQVGHAIAARGRCLLVLDNFEQIVAHASATLAPWLDAAPEACFVVTSREVLHLPGEEVFALDTLPIEGAAFDLFVRRAQAQEAAFTLDEARRASIVEIVRLLDGLPLAIELAASRVRLLSPCQLLARLRERFQVLASMRGGPARQATLRATIDWSWHLLSPWEQSAFAQCSVFEGRFTLEAAEAVLDLSPWPHAPLALDVVQALCDKSLVRTSPALDRDDGSAADPLLHMYNNLREYAGEKLATSGDGLRRTVERRHGAFYARLGTEASITALSRRGGAALARILTRDRDNVMAACRRAIQNDDASVAVDTYAAAWELLDRHGPSREGVALGAAIADMASLTPLERARSMLVHGTALRRDGRMDEAARVLERALDLARTLPDRRHLAKVMLVLAGVRADQNDMTEARNCIELATAIALEIRDPGLEGSARNFLGIVEAEQGRYGPALDSLEAALTLQRTVGDSRGEGAATANVANVLRLQGDIPTAIAYFERALAIQREVGDRRVEGLAIGNLGVLYSEQGRHAEARASLERAMVLHREVGNRHAEGRILGALGRILADQGLIVEARAQLSTGEDLLRDVGDSEGLATLLCDRAVAEVAANDLAAARAALTRAEEVITTQGLSRASEAGQRVSALRERLAGE